MTATVINATVNGYEVTGGNTAELVLQVGGQTAITINSNAAWVLSEPLTVDAGGTGANTAAAGLANLGGVTTGKAIAMAIVFGG
jgi:predicted metal-dependent TIM-barrel fold hydrolase